MLERVLEGVPTMPTDGQGVRDGLGLSVSPEGSACVASIDRLQCPQHRDDGTVRHV
jgi:hypothetical protein